MGLDINESNNRYHQRKLHKCWYHSNQHTLLLRRRYYSAYRGALSLGFCYMLMVARRGVHAVAEVEYAAASGTAADANTYADVYCLVKIRMTS